MDSSARHTLAMVIAVIMAAFAVAGVVACAGCSRTDEQPAMGDTAGRFVVVDTGKVKTRLAYTHWTVLEDAETGVQYLWCIGTGAYSGGLTPLLRPDGTPYTRENSSTGAEAYMPRRGHGTEAAEPVA